MRKIFFSFDQCFHFRLVNQINRQNTATITRMAYWHTEWSCVKKKLCVANRKKGVKSELVKIWSTLSVEARCIVAPIYCPRNTIFHYSVHSFISQFSFPHLSPSPPVSISISLAIYIFLTREDWTIYRRPSFLAVLWFDHACPLRPFSPRQ